LKSQLPLGAAAAKAERGVRNDPDNGCFTGQSKRSIIPKVLSEATQLQSIEPNISFKANRPFSQATVFGFFPSASATIRNPSVSTKVSSPVSRSFFK
jgi:hypothetical protein